MAIQPNSSYNRRKHIIQQTAFGCFRLLSYGVAALLFFILGFIIVKGIRKRKREIIMTFVEGKLAVFLSKWLPGLVDRLSYSLMAKEPDSPFK